MASIVLRNVEKYFGDNYIVRKLNLEIRHREFLVLLGPSGCGKTTTLRAIAGLEEIDSGEILIDGQPVQSRQAADRDIAFVFQLFALYPHLTAYGNIAFPLRATNEKRNVVDLRVREVAKALRIDGLLDKRPSALSGGDMQRVAIGRALVRRPKALSRWAHSMPSCGRRCGPSSSIFTSRMKPPLSTSPMTRSRPWPWPTGSPS